MENYLVELQAAKSKAIILEEELKEKNFCLKEAITLKEEAEKKADYYASKCNMLKEIFINCIKQL